MHTAVCQMRITLLLEYGVKYVRINRKIPKEQGVKNMKFAFFTLGCKVNLFETQALEQLAVARGHEVVERDADAVIINTCTVTSVSDRKNIRAFHKLRRDNPCAVIAACGCFAQTDPDRVRSTGEIDLICGTSDRAQTIALCEDAVQGKNVAATVRQPVEYEYLPAGIPHGRTRGLLKIEDGCNNFCTYCIIPYARGRVRSLPPRQVLEEAARTAAADVHEIVLTGIEIASYGQDLDPQCSLTDLLCQLLSAFPAIRFRLGSLDPRLIDRDFCEQLRCYDNLALHFHLSLQSGSDAVLKRMGRKYTAAQYLHHVGLLRETFPDCSITTDLIVGFPGETEQEFAETLAFLQQCAFSSVHVFPYSAREGTRAAAMPGQCSMAEKNARAERAKQIAAELRTKYLQRFIGRTLHNVLPEHQSNGCWTAHGRYGFPIYIASGAASKNQPGTIRVINLYHDGVEAEILSNHRRDVLKRAESSVFD